MKVPCSDAPTGRQYHKKPQNLAQMLSFLRCTIPPQKNRGGSGGQRPDIVLGTAEGAEGARTALGQLTEGQLTEGQLTEAN